MIELSAVSKSFSAPSGEPIEVLREVDLVVERGRSLAVVGPSGSGKSTLLAVMAGLERPSAGVVRADGVDLYAMGERERAAWRARSIGFVFQGFHLLGAFSALENVVIAAEIAQVASPVARAKDALLRVGLADRTTHVPTTLSGGERQRVAIARAIVARPPLVLADEPTGSLDAASAARVVSLLESLTTSIGSSLVVVTHDLALAGRMQSRVALEHGVVVSRERAP